MAVSFKGAHFPQDSILTGVRWYVAYPLSPRHVEELVLERWVYVDHSTINRWVSKYSPQPEEAFHRRKRPVWVGWWMEAAPDGNDGLLLPLCNGSGQQHSPCSQPYGETFSTDACAATAITNHGDREHYAYQHDKGETG